MQKIEHQRMSSQAFFATVNFKFAQGWIAIWGGNPLQSWPLHFERIDFLGADVAREQRRLIGGESKPLPGGADRFAANLAEICDVLHPAIAHPQTSDSVRFVQCGIVLEVEIFSVMRPHRVTNPTVTRSGPLLCGGIEEHQLL